MLELNGILLINKPVGVTSYDVIRKLKPFFPKKYKIGHAGTLDPFAEGLLIILIGKGTKLMNKFLCLKKKYTFRMEFGYETDTQDNTGEVTMRDGNLISNEEINEITKGFIGKYMQMPPQFSAKKVRGVRSYDLARKGIEVKLEPKEVEIFDLIVNSYEWPIVECEATVSSGTYIRTLTVDIANKLGTCATTISLRRDSIGALNLGRAFELSDVSEDVIVSKLISIDEANGSI